MTLVPDEVYIPFLIKRAQEIDQQRQLSVEAIDLAIAYPVDDRIGFTLTVTGQPQKFEMTRSAAASFAGRIAEALAK